MTAELEALLRAAKETVASIGAVKSAFGAPGDYGYDTAHGKSLYALYRASAEINAAIAAVAIATPSLTSDRRAAEPLPEIRPVGCRNLPTGDEAASARKGLAAVPAQLFSTGDGL
jgi:hypothetical protein